MAKGGVVIEEKFISLYDKIPNALRPSKIVPPPLGKESRGANGIIVSSSL